MGLLTNWIFWVGLGVSILGLLAFISVFVRYIPNNKVGVVEKLWSGKGSLVNGQIIALGGEAGYQANILRGGIHFGLWRWQYAVHKLNLVQIRQGKIGYVFARDGQPIDSGQTLGKVVYCNDFQDPLKFLKNGGQRGRQRAILREGVYATNMALFSIITETDVFTLGADKNLDSWRKGLLEKKGFDPVIVGTQSNADDIGIVTVHDGPALSDGEIIAPAVAVNSTDPNFHNNYQDIEAFLRAGGRRGLQYAPIIDGTYFINRWFATVELIPKQVVPIGHVGVVVSYYGKTGHDMTGSGFRHGEQVGEDERGVRVIPLGPGKYAFNTYAGNIILVPTTNFVLHWITGKTEGHRYDDSLKSIELVTRDAYEPTLPLSVVVHIDYQRAPRVIQRFGDIKQLITQTLDPLLSAFFRDVAHRKTMLELVHSRDEIQKQAKEALQGRFAQFDIECVDVLIGKPDSDNDNGKIENLLEQLRLRQLSVEQQETFGKQEAAAAKQQSLNEAQAKAKMQTELTNSAMQVQIVANQADAELEKSRKQAEQMVVLAKAQSDKSEMLGRGEAAQISQVGMAEAEVLQKKINSFGSPQLYALSQVAAVLANGKHPLVPASLIIQGGSDTEVNTVSLLLGLLTAEKTGFPIRDHGRDAPVLV